MSKKVVYISGPISGVPHYKDHFEAAAVEIEAHGFIALLPTWLPEGLSNKQYMRINFAMIDSADAVYFLPTWPASKGAGLEKKYCEYTEKLHFTKMDTLLAVLEEKEG